MPLLDDTYDTSFLRGPISSLFLTNSLSNFISDGAYSLAKTKEYDTIINTTKKIHDVSFMPYLRTNQLIDWEKICKNAGVNYISPHPTDGIENKLIEIASSKKIITEAMHGAILADIFRIPWTKLQFVSDLFETGSVNETKWQDWSRSIKTSYKTTRTCTVPHKISTLPKLYKAYISFNKSTLSKKIETTISDLKETNSNFSLSDDSTFNKIVNRIGEKIDLYNS